MDSEKENSHPQVLQPPARGTMLPPKPGLREALGGGGASSVGSHGAKAAAPRETPANPPSEPADKHPGDDPRHQQNPSDQAPPETPVSILKQRKALSRMDGKKRRRVSFAPDSELETRHLYNLPTDEDSPAAEDAGMQAPPLTPPVHKSPAKTPPRQSPAFLRGPYGPVPTFSPAPSRAESDSMSVGSTPGGGSTMDLTECTSRVVAMQDHGFDVLNTDALPSLAEIAEHTRNFNDEALQQHQQLPPCSPFPNGEETAELPSLADLADDDALGNSNNAVAAVAAALNAASTPSEAAPFYAAPSAAFDFSPADSDRNLGAAAEGESLTAQLSSLAEMMQGEQGRGDRARGGTDPGSALRPTPTASSAIMNITNTSNNGRTGPLAYATPTLGLPTLSATATPAGASYNAPGVSGSPSEDVSADMDITGCATPAAAVIGDGPSNPECDTPAFGDTPTLSDSDDGASMGVASAGGPSGGRTMTMCLATTPLPASTGPKAEAPEEPNEMTMGYSKIWEQGAHPAWGSYAAAEAADAIASAGEEQMEEEEEDMGMDDGGFSDGERTAGSELMLAPGSREQRNRWGVVPGQDDTLDLDLGLKARHQMGDATWHHVYGGGSTAGTTGDLTRKMRLGGFLSEETKELDGLEEVAEDLKASTESAAVPAAAEEEEKEKEVPGAASEGLSKHISLRRKKVSGSSFSGSFDAASLESFGDSPADSAAAAKRSLQQDLDSSIEEPMAAEEAPAAEAEEAPVVTAAELLAQAALTPLPHDTSSPAAAAPTSPGQLVAAAAALPLPEDGTERTDVDMGEDMDMSVDVDVDMDMEESREAPLVPPESARAVPPRHRAPSYGGRRSSAGGDLHQTPGMLRTPTMGLLDAGHTARLLMDSATKSHTPACGAQGPGSAASLAFSSASLVPLSLSGGSKTSAESGSSGPGAHQRLRQQRQRDEDRTTGSSLITAGVTTRLLADNTASGRLGGDEVLGDTEAVQEPKDMEAPNSAEGEKLLESAFGVALGAADDNDSPLLTAETPTQRLAQFGRIPTPSRPPLPSPAAKKARQSSVAPPPPPEEQDSLTQPARSRSGLEELEGTFQSLAGQLEALKPKARRGAAAAAAAPLHQQQEAPPSQAAEAEPQEATDQHQYQEQLITGGPRLARSPPGITVVAPPAAATEAPEVLHLSSAAKASFPSATEPQQAEKKQHRQQEKAEVAGGFSFPSLPQAASSTTPSAATAVPPGGPKLPRTPPGQSYAAPSLFAMGTNPQQGSNGNGTPGAPPAFPSPSPAPFGLSYATGPVRPSSAEKPTNSSSNNNEANGNGGDGSFRASLDAAAARAITFKSFLDLADVRFLDRLRRGTSIGGAVGLPGRADPPKTLQGAYELLCATVPELEEAEQRAAMLGEEVAERKRQVASLEEELSAKNPPVFAKMQAASGEELEGLKRSVGALKGACRARSVARWKQWRADREAEVGRALAENLAILRRDLEASAGNRRVVRELLSASRSLAAEQSAGRTAAPVVSAEEGQKLVETKREEIRALDGAAQELETRVEALRHKLGSLGETRAALVARWTAAKDSEASSCCADHLESGMTMAQGVMEQDHRLGVLQGLTGWKVEAATDSLAGPSAGQIDLRCSRGIARLRLHLSSPSHGDAAANAAQPCVRGLLELLPGSSSRRHQLHHSPGYDALVARFLVAGAGCLARKDALQGSLGALPPESSDVGAVLAELSWPCAARAAVDIQGIYAAASRLGCLLDELDDLRTSCPGLSGLRLKPDGSALELRLLDVPSQCLFTLDLSLGPSYPLGPDGLAASGVSVRFPGLRGVTAAAILEVVRGVPAGYRRIERVCASLAQLASGALQA